MNEDRPRIYADVLWCVGPKRPDRERPTGSQPRAQKLAAPSIDEIIDNELLRILEDAARPGESVQACFDRKEHDVRALVSSLAREELSSLRRRFEEPQGALDLALRRLSVDRRNRLATFITSARGAS